MTDIELLEILDLHEGDGLSASRIAVQFGRSRGAILGLVRPAKSLQEIRRTWTVAWPVNGGQYSPQRSVTDA